MIGLLLLAAAAAPARCALSGWSTDRDPAGLRVHAGPALSSPEVGRLPPAIVTNDDEYAPEFDIVDAAGGWVRIAHADDAFNPGRRRPVFGGTGWVHGSRVAFTVQTEVGRAAPNVRAPVVVASPDLFSDAGGTAQPVLACSGGWVRLHYTLPRDARVLRGPRTGEAWFGGVCGNQRTTCDGLDERTSRPGR